MNTTTTRNGITMNLIAGHRWIEVKEDGAVMVKAFVPSVEIVAGNETLTVTQFGYRFNGNARSEVGRALLAEADAQQEAMVA